MSISQHSDGEAQENQKFKARGIWRQLWLHERPFIKCTHIFGANISVYVHMCVYMCVMCVYMFVCIFMCVNVYIHVWCVYMCIWVYVFVCVHVCMCVYLILLSTYLCHWILTLWGSVVGSVVFLFYRSLFLILSPSTPSLSIPALSVLFLLSFLPSYCFLTTRIWVWLKCAPCPQFPYPHCHGLKLWAKVNILP